MDGPVLVNQAGDFVFNSLSIHLRASPCEMLNIILTGLWRPCTPSELSHFDLQTERLRKTDVPVD
jgi:hypothetical protein